MPQGQPSDPPAPAAQAAVASPTGVVIRPMGPDDAGQVLAQGSPAAVRESARSTAAPEPDMEEAFIAIVERARRQQVAV